MGISRRVLRVVSLGQPLADDSTIDSKVYLNLN